MPAFARTIGIDYSGAETPTASLKGRDLRQRGRGPRWITLPTGDIRYTVEELDAWSRSCGLTIRVTDKTNLVAFPGVRIRTVLAPKPNGQRSGRQNRGAT
jgi:hypothetical protein